LQTGIDRHKGESKFMLLLETKFVAVGESRVKVYSVDGGKLWFTRAVDVKQFKRRRHQDKEILKRWISRLFPDDG
jgi:hypothetical protein